MKTVALGFVCIAILGAALPVPSASAAVLALQPGPGFGKDTFAWYRSGFENLDLSASELMWTQHNSYSWNSRSYIQFDLSGLGAGATVTGAELVLHHVLRGSNTWPLQTTPFKLTEITSAWDQTTATWNNQPTLGSAYAVTDYMYRNDLVWSATFGTSGAWLGTTTVDLTSLVDAWHTGALTNNGFAYYMDTSYGFNAQDHNIVASDYLGDPSWRPELIITYVPEPASLALLALGLAGLRLSRRRNP